MGWKTSITFITRPSTTENSQVLNLFGLKNLTQLEDATLEDVIHSVSEKVFIGLYNDNLIIYEWHIPNKVEKEESSYYERQLVNLFPQSEICFVELTSTVGYWGYKIIQNGKVIRHRAGDGDNGTFIDKGEPLEQEIELLNKSTVDSNNNRIYKFEEMPNDIFSESQVGENFVFNICSRYIDYPLDEAVEFTEQTKFNCYIDKKSKSWWQFWK